LAISVQFGLVKVPDLVTHDPPQRTEFYEIKPNSPDGRLAGLIKIAELDALMHFSSLPYRPGTIYSPHKRLLLFTGILLGKSLTAAFVFRRVSPGLIVYYLCAEGDLVESVARIAVVVTGIIVIILIGSRLPKSGAIPAPSGSPLLAIQSNVGRGGINHADDVGVVQFLLNLARVREKSAQLAMDGIAGPKTNAAILEYQQKHHLPPDGRVDPGAPTLLRAHFKSS
jgi:hypothetical protein